MKTNRLNKPSFIAVLQEIMEEGYDNNITVNVCISLFSFIRLFLKFEISKAE